MNPNQENVPSFSKESFLFFPVSLGDPRCGGGLAFFVFSLYYAHVVLFLVSTYVLGVHGVNQLFGDTLYDPCKQPTMGLAVQIFLHFFIVETNGLC